MYELRDYQDPAPIWEWMRARKGIHATSNPLVVLPTGAGKSIVIAAIIKDMLEKYGGRRVIVLAHQKELLVQNYEKLNSIYPEAQAGIYSSSLRKRQTNNKVLFCGIQSVWNKAHELGDFSLIIVDECHLIPTKKNGRYRHFFNEMAKLAGRPVPVVGLTATPYRLDSGYLHIGKDALFDGIAHEVFMADLLERGFLCPLTTKKTSFIIDISSVKKRGGEFVESDLMAAVDPVTDKALNDAMPKIEGRKTGLVFCVSVEHANHVAAYLNANGVSCAVVSGKTPSKIRDELIKNLKSGHIRCLANVNCLTTGVDVPNIDFLIMLRPTQSVGLYVQMSGRGLRISESKTNCLVLDYAGNIQRLGAVDDVNIRQKKDEEKQKGEAPVKACPECESIVHAARAYCPDCGFEFPVVELQLDKESSRGAILSSDYIPEWREVSRTAYRVNKGKDGKPDTIMVEYFSDGGVIENLLAREFVCAFHSLGKAKDMAKKWVNQRIYFENNNCLHTGIVDFDSCQDFVKFKVDADYGLAECFSEFLTSPTHLLLDNRGKYATIINYKFPPRTLGAS